MAAMIAAGVAKGSANKVGKLYSERSRPVKTGILAVIGAAVLGLIDHTIGFADINHTTSVREAQLAKLTLAQTIPPETVVARAVAHYEGIKAADHYDICVDPSKIPLIGGLLPGKQCSPHIASWSEAYSGDIGAKIWTTKALTIPQKYDPNALRRDGKRGAFVVDFDRKSFGLDVYEMDPGKGFTSDNSIGASIVTDLMNKIKAIPGLDATWIDDKYNALQNMDLKEAFREMAAPQGCGNEALDVLMHPGDIDADAKLKQPKTIQGSVIRQLVIMDNGVLKAEGSDIRVSSEDFVAAPMSPTSVTLPTEYTQFKNAVATHPPDGTNWPSESSIHQCLNATGLPGGHH